MALHLENIKRITKMYYYNALAEIYLITLINILVLER